MTNKDFIKIPKEINTFSKFMEWLNSFDSVNNPIEVRMKRNIYENAYNFHSLENGSRIGYLISNSHHYGNAKVSSVNRVFTFKKIK